MVIFQDHCYNGLRVNLLILHFQYNLSCVYLVRMTSFRINPLINTALSSEASPVPIHNYMLKPMGLHTTLKFSH